MTNPSTEPVRERLTVEASPTDILRRLRGKERLVALIGAWHQGEALIAFEPIRLLEQYDRIDLPPSTQTTDAFGGGWIGAWGYRLGLNDSLLAEEPPRPNPQNDLRVGFYDMVLRFVSGSWWLECLGEPDPRRRDELLEMLETDAEARDFEVGTFVPTPGRDEHLAAVAKVLDHIRSGDISQVNLCMRLDSDFTGDPLDAFCAGVEILHPAYAAYVSTPSSAIVSFSPELFLRRTGTTVLSSPIKGTAPLDADPEELIASAKNHSENVIAVDLMRGDLGKVAVPGTVRVPALTRLEKHSVWHLVSDVIADLSQETTDGDLLRATFPPGSVTGVPKERSLEIVTDTEATAREVYTGAIGHVSAHAGMELNVVIRTFEFARETRDHWKVWLGVGGGIGIDSDPADEFAECLVKATPLVAAIGGELAVRPDPPAAPVDLKVRPAEPATHADRQQGVFETLLVTDGQARHTADHIARLDASTRSLWGVSVRAGLAAAVEKKVLGSTGEQRLRVKAVPQDDDVVIELELEPLGEAESSWQLVPRVLPGGMGEHKWIDRRLLASEPGREPLLLDTDGSILETARGSLFLVMDDGLHTPALDGRILPGTTRARIIEKALALGVPVQQRRLTTADLQRANEVFACNALRGIVPVISCDGVGEWPSGPLAALLGADRSPTERRPQPSFSDSPKVLLLDNRDSFANSLAQTAARLGAETGLVGNTPADLDLVLELVADESVTHLVLPPGSASPGAAGMGADILRHLAGRIPVLGVGLGHLLVGEVFGGRTASAPPVHGRASLVHHDGTGIFTGAPSPLVCGRYDSLVVADPGPDLVVTARTGDGTVMGMRHRELEVHTVQFHPESLLTPDGDQLIANFLALGAGRQSD